MFRASSVSSEGEELTRFVFSALKLKLLKVGKFASP